MRRRRELSPPHSSLKGSDSVPRNLMDRFIDTIELIAAIFVGIVAADTFLIVVLRYFFSFNIPDSYDFGQLLLGILIFSIGILALIGMQATAIRNTADARYRSEASFLATEVIGRMWLDIANIGDFDKDSGAFAPRDVLQRRLHGQASVTGPRSVIFMSHGRPEEGHDAIAQHLVHRPLEAVHGVHHALQRRIEECLGGFRVEIAD